MGTNLKDLMVRKEIKLKDLDKKKLVVDAFNVLYQFLATIRQRDGTLLTDSHGNVTSHLIGLFSRTTSLMQNGLKLAFVFDGKAPKLKHHERQRRRDVKEKAMKQYEEAAVKEDFDAMKKYASRTSRLTGDMVEDAKKLLQALGIPVVQAPSEGEAQAAHIVKRGDAYASISQDYDSLLYAVPRLVQNLTISSRRKVKGKVGYQTILPTMIDLKENLKNLGINQKQLIALGMLVGTDYNVGGIKGIGPKNALKLVKQHKDDLDSLFKHVKWDEHIDVYWQEIFNVIENTKTTDKYEMEWKPIEPKKLIKLLCDKHEFGEERVRTTIEKIEDIQAKQSQRSLFDY